PIVGLFAVALIVGALFVLRLLTAPEPLIPISILKNRIVRCAIIANAFGWGSIIGLNVFLPMYLQGVMGRSASQAGLSLVVLMLALNASAGLAGQVLGRVRHYKLLPMIGLVLSTAATAALAWQAHSMASFELTLIAIGVGFGPVPSLTAVALPNVVPRHRLRLFIGTIEFSKKPIRNHADRGVRRHRLGRFTDGPITWHRFWRGESGRGVRPIVRGGGGEYVDCLHRDRRHGAEAAADRGRTRRAMTAARRPGRPDGAGGGRRVTPDCPRSSAKNRGPPLA